MKEKEDKFECRPQCGFLLGFLSGQIRNEIENSQNIIILLILSIYRNGISTIKSYI